MFRRARKSLLTLGGIFTFIMIAAHVRAESYYKGATTCQECHGAEYQVWENTKHFASFREVSTNPKAEAILAAAGGSTSMKSNDTCVACHFTSVNDSPEAAARPRSGPSCESCHGASSDWLAIHNDYGGPSVAKADETPEHRDMRIANAREAGMIRPDMKYDVATNCMACHGLARPEISGEAFSKMLEAGHPFQSDFELVRYSQGSIRHRFYEPTPTTNAEMTPTELARLFVTGQAAKLVSATEAASRSDHPDYKAAQEKRAGDARAALEAVKNVPEVGTFLSSPTETNARALVSAIEGKDLTAEVGALLPDPATYK